MVLHAAFFVLSSFGGSFPKVDVRRHPRISAIISTPSQTAKREVLTRINNEYRIPATRQQRLAESTDAQVLQNESAQPSSSLIIDPADLDTRIVPLAELELEPEYGFSDDAIGRVILNLLISDTGAVVWVGVASADLDAISTSYIVKAFASAKFSTPLVAGRPVYTMIQVEVGVGRQ